MSRWISGIILAAAVILLLLKAPPEAAQGVVVALAAIAAWEFATLSLGRDPLWQPYLAAVLAGGGVAVQFFAPRHADEGLLLCGFLVAAFLCQFNGPHSHAQKIQRAAFFFLAAAYAFLLCGFLGMIPAHPQRVFWLFTLLAVTFLADTFAYLAGRACGRHKLAPQLSPGKTVEGLFGGIAGALLAGFAVRAIFRPDFHAGMTAGLALVLALVGVLGDLSESLLKRGFGAKDSGNLIPGHGGVLDRIDALLFNAPVVWAVAVYWDV